MLDFPLLWPQCNLVKASALVRLRHLFSVVSKQCLKCESASSRSQPEEALEWSLLCDYEKRRIVWSSNKYLYNWLGWLLQAGPGWSPHNRLLFINCSCRGKIFFYYFQIRLFVLLVKLLGKSKTSGLVKYSVTLRADRR